MCCLVLCARFALRFQDQRNKSSCLNSTLLPLEDLYACCQFCEVMISDVLSFMKQVHIEHSKDVLNQLWGGGVAKLQHSNISTISVAAQRNISSSSHTLNYIFQLARQPFLISLPAHKVFGLRKKAAEFTSTLPLISFANCSTSSVSRRPRLYAGFEWRWTFRPCWIYNHIWYWLFSINPDIPQLTCCLRARQRKWS